MIFNFILADGTVVNSPFTAKPLNSPIPNSPGFFDGNIITSSFPPVDLTLAPNQYKIENIFFQNNDWNVTVGTGSITTVFGCDINSPLCQVTFLPKSAKYQVDAFTSMSITPIYKNVMWSGSFVMGNTLECVTDASGSLVVNLVPMPYEVVIKQYLKTCFTILPSGSNCFAEQVFVTTKGISKNITPQNKELFAYTAQVSDLRYLQQGGAINFASSSISSSYALSASYAPLAPTVIYSKYFIGK